VAFKKCHLVVLSHDKLVVISISLDRKVQNQNYWIGLKDTIWSLSSFQQTSNNDLGNLDDVKSQDLQKNYLSYSNRVLKSPWKMEGWGWIIKYFRLKVFQGTAFIIGSKLKILKSKINKLKLLKAKGLQRRKSSISDLWRNLDQN